MLIVSQHVQFLVQYFLPSFHVVNPRDDRLLSTASPGALLSDLIGVMVGDLEIWAEIGR